MLSEKQIEAVEETAAALAQRRQQRPVQELRPKRPAAQISDRDYAWAQKNLRLQDGRPVLDAANVVRVFERHEDFKGRFVYNETLGKVLDKGSVMLDWRISECCVVVQERFMPDVGEATVYRALVVCANRNGSKK